MNGPKLIVGGDAAEVYSACADAVVQALQTVERPSIVLAGGSTPRGLYELLTARYPDAFDWRAAEYWFGDERCVGPLHPKSNFRLAQETLFEPFGVPSGQIRRMLGELGAEEGARRYAERLRAERGDPPHFDVVLLGMGAEGHTASLFPESPALFANDLAVGAKVPAIPAERITMTPRALSSARCVFFLLLGNEKRDALRRALSGQEADPSRPTSFIRGAQTVFFCDRDAAPDPSP